MPTLLTVDTEQDHDRRTSARVSYGAVLGVIEHNGTLPAATEMRPVKALDLSHTGVSFTTTRWPSSDWLLIMLGSKQKPRYASARVVGCQTKATTDDTRRFEVHCEFEQWLAPSNA
ncbi:MAG: hypothetical protein H6822_08015 [Planctomycetaceae bacterium]|nr:hypothetical protein [Planctomycetales bacterium]MCB9922112.1 hypothetical protein [Planctomycetaceae bacterium]